MPTTLSMQLYSARNFPPLGQQMETLKTLGYTHVEPFGGLYGDLDALKAALRESGLAVPSGHFAVAMLEDEFDRAISIARALGVSIIVLPHIQAADRPTDSAGWVAFGKRVAAIAAAVRAAGLRLAWHNHDFEMRPLEDGSRPLEHILGEGDVEWEADAAWIVRGGEDPVAWIKRYSGRIAALHVKDIAPAGEKTDEDGWADVGVGTMDWPAIWAAAKESGCDLMIAEHDNPSDFERFARVSLAAMRRLDGAN